MPFDSRETGVVRPKTVEEARARWTEADRLKLKKLVVAWVGYKATREDNANLEFDDRLEWAARVSEADGWVFDAVRDLRDLLPESIKLDDDDARLEDCRDELDALEAALKE